MRMKRERLRALDWSPSSLARLVPCSCWACVWERVVGPVFGCPPEGSDFPPGVVSGFPLDWSAFLSLSGLRSEHQCIDVQCDGHKAKTINSIISESCANFLVAELYSLRVPATRCSTTSTPRLIILEARKNISWTPSTLPRGKRPQLHQPSWHQSPNLLVDLNLRTLYPQCP